MDKNIFLNLMIDSGMLHKLEFAYRTNAIAHLQSLINFKDFQIFQSSKTMWLK